MNRENNLSPSPHPHQLSLRGRSLDARFLLLGLFFLGLGLRLLYLHDISDQPFFQDLIIDQAAYDEWALAIAGGEAPAEVFYQDPLYPYFLALIYKIFGRNLWLIYVIQITISSAGIFLLYGISRRSFGETEAGLFAAFLWAVSQVDFFYAGQVEKTSPGVVLCLLALWLLLVARDRPRIWFSSLAGLTLGLLPLFRGNFLAVVPFLGLWWGVTIFRREGRNCFPALVCFVVFAMLPVFLAALRNRVVAGEWVLTTAQGGENFYLGNFRENTWGTGQDPSFVRRVPRFEQADFHREAFRRTGRQLSPAELSRFWFREGWREITAAPGLSLLREARKALLLLNRHELSDNLSYDFFRERFSWVLRLPLPGNWWTISLGLAGMALALYRKRGDLLLLYVFSYSATLLVFYVLGRYRMPLLPVFMAFAGFGVVKIGEAMREKRRGELVLFFALFLLAGLLAFPRWLTPAFDVAWYKLGNSYAREGRWEEAIQAYQSALEENPRRVETLVGLGQALLQRHRWAEAETVLQKATAEKPDQAPAHYLRGLALLGLGREEEAKQEFDLAQELDPSLTEAIKLGPAP